MADAILPMPVFILKLVVIPFLCILMLQAFGESTKPESAANERKLAFEDVPAFIRIDCGAGDDDYIDTGIGMNISPEFIDSIDKAGQTLRSFPNGRRSCYTLKPEGAIINNKYLIRASFVYGNYDNLNQVPIFDLHIGVNKWTTVILSTPSEYSYMEIIYVSSTVHIDLCLVNTGSGVPFISQLELKVLDDSMYEIEPGSSLLYGGRWNAGALKSASDEYGRTWNPQVASGVPHWLPFNTTESILSLDGNNKNRVPDIVWSTAAQSENASMPLDLTLIFPNTSSYRCHSYFYFAEINSLQQREMTIHLNNEPTANVTLGQYLTPVTIGPLKANVTGSLTFSIKSVDQRLGLPPILNGIEFYILNKLSNHPTDTEDVAAMMDIKKIFKVTRNWQGDPCVPRNLSWEGINCEGDNPPRIVSLNLSSSNLTGELPASLSKLTAIQSFDLSYNKLNGSVLESLAQLKELTVLNLTGNKLTGSVPPELKKKFKDSPELLRLDGNQLCLSDSCNKKKKQYVIPVVVSTVSLLFLVAILSALVIFMRNKRQMRELLFTSKKGSLKSKNRLFSFHELESITGNFKTVIGEGGFGKVYHGVLTDKTQVAVKLLSKSSKQGCKEFRAEAQLLMIVHHRNLVSLVGYCNENDHMGLIYEYMPNGNLQQQLSDSKENHVLNWGERLQVAVSSAQGLEYLHNGCKPPIIHRDLKPANILLDEKLQAKIADFGLSKAFSAENESYMETNPAGTLGYLDPEYQACGNLNKKSDVYSFGIILFELITGQRAIIRGSDSYTHIVRWVNPKIGRGDINDIVDPRLRGEFVSNAAWKAVEVAMLCVEPTAIQRPDMNHVLVGLKEALELETRFERSLSVESKKSMSTNYSLVMESVEFGEDDMTPQAR